MRNALLAALLALPVAAGSSAKIPAADVVEPQALSARLKDKSKPAPLVIHVGFSPLYKLGHIPGSEYFGPGSKPEPLVALRRRLSKVPRDREIVLYCGCCPWVHCPNIEPAFAAVRAMGFKNVKTLHLERSFGQDWTEAGLPVAKGA